MPIFHPKIEFTCVEFIFSILFLIFTEALKIEWALKDNTITYDFATYNIVFDFALE